MQNKVEKKIFLGMDVRVVNREYMVLKDMFSALGRLREDNQMQSADRNKVKELADLGVINHGETLTMVVKRGQTEDLGCVLLSDVPLILTQFRPTARAGELALKTWVDFMKFVNDLLTSLEVYKYIITDKQKQLNYQDEITELGGSAMRMNVAVCEIMAQLIGVDGKVKKDDLRTYQNQTTIDLLDVHSFVTKKFTNAYEFTGSYKESKDMVVKLALNKYPFKTK